MYRTDDPIADFNRHDAEQQRRIIRFPLCSECGERILDDDCYEFDGNIICPECLKENHLKRTVDYIVEEC